MEYKLNAEITNYDFYESTLNKTYYRNNTGYKKQSRSQEDLNFDNKAPKKKAARKVER